MLVTVEWMQRKYDEFNQKYWNGELPRVQMIVMNRRTTYGYASYRYNTITNTVTPTSIKLSNYYDTSERGKENTLLHEMVHIADYYFHPEHFVWNGRKVSKRSYDAHGPVFFLKEAARINKDGYQIERYASFMDKDEQKESERTERLLAKRKSEPAHMLMFRYWDEVARGNMYWYIVKSSKKGALFMLNNFKKHWGHLFEGFEVWLSYDERLQKMRSQVTTLRGWNKTDEQKEEFIRKYNCEFSISNLSKKPAQIEKEKPKTLHFVMRTIQDDKKYEFTGTTKEEIKEKLREIYPRFNDEIIDKIVNNPKFYVDEGKKMKKKTLNEVDLSQNNMQETAERREMVRKIDDNTFEVSIE